MKIVVHEHSHRKLRMISVLTRLLSSSGVQFAFGLNAARERSMVQVRRVRSIAKLSQVRLVRLDVGGPHSVVSGLRCVLDMINTKKRCMRSKRLS